MSDTASSRRLIALDLDGTLLNHNSEITPATRQALADAVSRGHIVLPATGRPLASLPTQVAGLPGVRYVITSNGAAVWNLGEDPVSAVYSRYFDAALRRVTQPVCLIRRPFAPEKARELFEVFSRYEGVFNIFSDGRSIRDPASHQRHIARMKRRGSTEAMQPNDGRFTIVRDTAEWFSRNAHSIEKFCMFFESTEAALAALPVFEAIEGVEVVQGAPDNIEVTAAGVDKGEALLLLADHLGIDREATVAVGDSENDSAMLQKAGVACAMANGMPRIKAMADLVSTNDCDHDGVAELFGLLDL